MKLKDEWLDDVRRRLDQPDGTVAVAKHLLWVRPRNGRMRPLLANPAQQAFEAQCRRENIVLKARQMGMTTWIAARFFLRTITRPGTMTLQVAHTREAAESLFATVRRMWNYLPEEQRTGSLQLRYCNKGQIVFKHLESEFRIATAADENAGRGLSVQNLHCSEVSRWGGDAKETLAGLRAALAPGGECVLESTANGAYGAFYEEWLSAEERGVARHFFPWWMEPAYVGNPVNASTLTEDEARLVDRHGLTRAQIGYRRGLQANYGNLREQEFAEDADTCFRATGACCFEVDAIESRMKEVLDPWSRCNNGAYLQWFTPQAKGHYVVGVDTAGGGADGDFAAVQVLDRNTGLQCAELQQRLTPAELARVVVGIAREYNNAVVAVERNNHGGSVLAYLQAAEGYNRIWHDDDGQAGWLTTSASKPMMMARLGAVLRLEPERISSRRLLAECRTFVSAERGRMGAANGEHDDLVMAMAVAESARVVELERTAKARPGHERVRD